MFYNYKIFFSFSFSCALALQLAFILCIGFDITYSSLLSCCCPFKLDIFVVLNTFVSFLVLWSFLPFLELWSYLFLFLHSITTSSSFWRLCFTHHRCKVHFIFWNFFRFSFATCFFKVLFVFVFIIHFRGMQIWTTTFYEQLFEVTSLFSTTFDLSRACKFLQFQLVFCVRKAHSPFFVEVVATHGWDVG